MPGKASALKMYLHQNAARCAFTTRINPSNVLSEFLKTAGFFNQEGNINISPFFLHQYHLFSHTKYKETIQYHHTSPDPREKKASTLLEQRAWLSVPTCRRLGIGICVERDQQLFAAPPPIKPYKLTNDSTEDETNLPHAQQSSCAHRFRVKAYSRPKEKQCVLLSINRCRKLGRGGPIRDTHAHTAIVPPPPPLSLPFS